MQLPYSEELNIGYLSRLFDNTTNCYKFFWFQAILSKLDSEHSRFTFDELINAERDLSRRSHHFNAKIINIIPLEE